MIEVQHAHEPTKIKLRCRLCPGDVCTLTAAVKSLHTQYPGQYLTDVDTPHNDLFANNPYITSLDNCKVIQCEYPLINRSNQTSYPFLEGYTNYLGDQLGKPLRLQTNKPDLYLSMEEKSPDYFEGLFDFQDSKPIGLINAGYKKDRTVKLWPHYQEVVYLTSGTVNWIQIGHEKDTHYDLDGVVSLVGKTSIRDLLALVYRADFGLGPVTFLQHVCAGLNKPYICLVGGTEPNTWVNYPLQHTLHTIGLLSCCRSGGCWRRRVVKLGDGHKGDNKICDKPSFGWDKPVAECMARISPCDVVSIVERLVNFIEHDG